MPIILFRTIRSALAGLLLLAPAALPSQSARNFDITKVAAGVYVFVQRAPLDSPIDGNSTVIINEHDVVIVDSKGTPATARAVIAEIRKLTSKPVRYVINTHWHGDHHYGNDAYRQAFPGVEFIGHHNTRADLLQFDTPAGLLESIERAPKSIADRQRYLASGLLADGSPLVPELREFYQRQIVGLAYNRDQLKRTVITPPTLLVTDSLVLLRGDRRIEIRFLGRANTRGDLVVYLPRERIVATGDVLVAPVPFAFGSYLGDWIRTLGAIRSLDAVAIIPGHGVVQHDWRYLDQVSTLLRSTLEQTRAAVAAGKSLDSTRTAVNLSAQSALFSGNSMLLARSFRNFFVLPAVERAYLEARGELDRK